jgi:Arc/MetJ-type ribon-helix-helix transcriptional regulator
MVFTLTPELEKLVQDKVAKGDYPSADALVEGAVQRLLEEEHEEDERSNAIRARIDTAEAEIDGGQYLEYDETNVHELSTAVHERGMRKSVSERPQTGPSE